MPCYSPLLAFVKEGPQGRIVLFRFDPKAKSVTLPCGRCIGCRLERARQWAVRIVHESKMHDDNVFVTLTYDPEFLPKDGSLSVVACQSFLKRLRSRLAPRRIRFFLCGEYGEKLQRPHYHAVVFGWWPADARPFKKNGAGDQLYTSELLSAAWGQGFCSFGAVTFESAAYVASYATKKVTGEAAAEHYKGRKPEFLLMSRGGRKAGGIGRSWIEKFHGDVYPSDEVVVRGVSCRPPRYYDRFLEGADSELLARLKEKRERESQVLEAATAADGSEVMLPVNFNPQRLRVREKIARAKLALKSRSLEGS